MLDETLDGLLIEHLTSIVDKRLVDQAFDPHIDELTFRLYAHNRSINPETSAQRWGALFQDGAALEERYQRQYGICGLAFGNGDGPMEICTRKFVVKCYECRQQLCSQHSVILLFPSGNQLILCPGCEADRGQA